MQFSLADRLVRSLKRADHPRPDANPDVRLPVGGKVLIVTGTRSVV